MSWVSENKSINSGNEGSDTESVIVEGNESILKCSICSDSDTINQPINCCFKYLNIFFSDFIAEVNADDPTDVSCKKTNLEG
jgi:hypothetical protein